MRKRWLVEKPREWLKQIGALKKVNEKGGKIVLIITDPQINKIFNITGLVKIFPIFKDEAEAIRMANDVAYGLAASIWTENHARAIRVSQDLDFGQIWVNCHLVQVGDMPNGGFKHSGHGNDLSAEALEGYTRMKHVMSYTAR